MSLATTYGELQHRYLELIANFPLRPIRSDTELDEAIIIIDALVELDALTEAEADYLAVLSDLVEQYENQAHPIAPASDAEMLRHLLEARETTPTILAQQTDIPEVLIADVLNGQRQLDREHIGKLAHFFQVPPGVFTFEA